MLEVKAFFPLSVSRGGGVGGLFSVLRGSFTDARFPGVCRHFRASLYVGQQAAFSLRLQQHLIRTPQLLRAFPFPESPAAALSVSDRGPSRPHTGFVCEALCLRVSERVYHAGQQASRVRGQGIPCLPPPAM